MRNSSRIKGGQMKVEEVRRAFRKALSCDCGYPITNFDWKEITAELNKLVPEHLRGLLDERDALKKLMDNIQEANRRLVESEASLKQDLQYVRDRIPIKFMHLGVRQGIEALRVHQRETERELESALATIARLKNRPEPLFHPDQVCICLKHLPERLDFAV